MDGKSLVFVVSCVSAAMVVVSAAAVQQDDLLERARALHRAVPMFDGHNDFPWEVRQKGGSDPAKLDIRGPQPATMTDIPRMRKGGVGAQFWSVYVPASLAGTTAVTATLEQIDIVYRMADRYPETFEIARTADDVERIFKAGRIASLIDIEGGHSIDNSLGALRMFYRLGARCMTLTHSKNVPWADSATDTPEHNGLTPFGEDVIREMNRLGMIIDLSHVSPAVMDAVLRITRSPVIFSHSSARALVDHPRNVPDAVLKKLPANGGVVMVSFVPGFTSSEVMTWEVAQEAEQARLEKVTPNDAAAVTAGLEAWKAVHRQPVATLAQVADHIDHVRKVAGIDHVGYGSDFDGISSAPKGLEDVSTFPALTAELLRRGYSDGDIKKVLGLNLLRVMRAVETTAKGG
ncbi:MAG: dipeptidase [Acidobacteria bacterium]|nr:dipeptidase [Acidobacteriota bacterium]